MDLETRTKGDTSRKSEPMGFESWAARPMPRKPSVNREAFDFDAFKIFLILAALTAGMALVLRLLF